MKIDKSLTAIFRSENLFVDPSALPSSNSVMLRFGNAETGRRVSCTVGTLFMARRNVTVMVEHQGEWVSALPSQYTFASRSTRVCIVEAILAATSTTAWHRMVNSFAAGTDTLQLEGSTDARDLVPQCIHELAAVLERYGLVGSNVWYVKKRSA